MRAENSESDLITVDFAVLDIATRLNDLEPSEIRRVSDALLIAASIAFETLCSDVPTISTIL